MRSFRAALASVVALLALAPVVGDAHAEHVLLPAPVTFTAGRATFRIARDGQLSRVAATPLRFHPSQRLYFVADGAVMTQPVGSGLLELLEGRRLIVLRPDGSVFAEALVPRRLSIDSPIAAAPDGRAVAFSASYTLRAASPDPARGALALETVYVLRAGARTATPLHTERVQFAPCLGGAGVAWHARWLLFSAGEGTLTVIDTAGEHRVIDFTPATRKLAGVSNGFGAYWGREPALD